MKSTIKLLLTFSLGLIIISALLYFSGTKTTLAETAPNQSAVIQAGLEFIKIQQQADGGILGFSGVSDPDATARTVMAFIAAKASPGDVLSAQGKTMLDYLASQAISYTHDTTGTLFPGRVGIILTAVVLSGEDGKSFGGMDLVGELEASFHEDTGTYSTTASQGYSSGAASDVSQAWAILGLSLEGRTIPPAAIVYLKNSQAPDGSWGAGDPDTTALVVTALLASRNETNQSQVIQKALEYFHTTQAPSAGWKPSWDTEPINADSTGWILQALVSAGEDVRGQTWTKDQSNPVDALLALQKPDGSIGGANANAYSTAEAIIGLSGIPLSNFGISSTAQRAGLAIFYSDSSVSTVCVSFNQGSITGLDLLEKSGLMVQTATNPNQGTAVCKIGDVGDSSENCFGSMPNYWAYWTLSANGWEYSATGAEQSQVTDGSVNAWSWGTGNPPPMITFENICEDSPYVLPTSGSASLPATETSAPVIVASVSTSVPTQTAPEATSNTKLPTSYIAYGAIIIVLGGLIIFLIRSRSR